MIARPTYSFVLPVYNEAGVLTKLHRRLSAVMKILDAPSEVILIDDGSVDGSYAEMLRLRDRDPRVKLVRLSRNFGTQAAITAGLDFAQGDAVIIMDSDLQHPPEVVPKLVTQWREGYEVITASRANRVGESWPRRTTAQLFYRLMRRAATVDVPPEASDFKLVDRAAIDALRNMRENTRFLRGMFSWVGFRQTSVEYDSCARYDGQSRYTVRRLVGLATDGIASFTNAPLQVALHLGLIVSALSFLFGAGTFVSWLLGTTRVPGWLTIVLLVSFLGGMQLLVLGVMGTYLGRMFDEVKRRPLYIVRESEGLDAVATPPDRTVVSRSPRRRFRDPADAAELSPR